MATVPSERSASGPAAPGADHFSSNMYRKVNVDAITEDRARHHGLEQHLP